MTQLRKTARRSWRFSVEKLEARIAPAVTVDFSRITDLLSVSSDGSDPIVLTTDAKGTGILNGVPMLVGGDPVMAATVSRIEINGGPGPNLIDLTGVKPVHYEYVHFKIDVTGIALSPPDTLRDLVIFGGGGDDTI